MRTVALRDVKAMNEDTSMPRLIIVPLFLLTLASASAPAQSGNDVTEQIWPDVNPAYFLNPDLKFFGDIGTRWEVGASGEIFATFTGQQGQMREQSRATLGLGRSLARDVHFRFELTWQEEGALFGEGDGATNLYFRFRLPKKWGHAQSLREESTP
jgi:hypothetical protein